MSASDTLPPRPPALRRPAITPARGGLHQRPNIFTREDFFRHDLAAGIHRLHDGQRAVLVSTEFLSDLVAGLGEEFGSDAAYLIYKCGFEWGLQDMKRFSTRMRQTYGGGQLDIWQMPRRFVLENWWLSFGVQGWGNWALDLSLAAQSVTGIEVQNSARPPTAESPAAEPTCHLYAGLFAGMMSFLDRAERQAVELQSGSVTSPSCQFLVGPAEMIERARSARDEGLAPAAILKLLS